MATAQQIKEAKKMVVEARLRYQEAMSELIYELVAAEENGVDTNLSKIEDKVSDASNDYYAALRQYKELLGENKEELDEEFGTFDLG